MLKPAPQRLATADSAAHRRSLALLALALAALCFAAERDALRWGGQYASVMSMNHLAVAANLSAEHGWLGFYHETLNAAGERVVLPYNRFPIGGHLLLRAAMLPFSDDPGAQLQAARRLALACFAGAIVLAYLALRRLSGSASVALAATLFGFSSFYPMQFYDLIATEATIDLFAVMLVLHGLALFALEGRFGQLLAKVCAELALGWHVYALLLPFVALSLLAEWRRGGSARTRIGRLARSRGLRLGAVALAFGLALLSFNFAREYAAVRAGETIAPASSALSELPSFRSMSKRLGWDAAFIEAAGGRHGWLAAAEAALFRAGRAFLPWSAERLARDWRERLRADDAKPTSVAAQGRSVEIVSRQTPGHDAQAMTPARKLAIAFGAGAIATTILGIAFTRHRVVLAALATSGPCWVLLLPGSAPHHYFEGLFMIGLPMAAICLALTWSRRFSAGWARGAVVAAFLAFAASVAELPRLVPGDDEHPLPLVLADYEAIARIAPKGAIIRSGRERRYARFFVPERVYVSNGFDQRHAIADFALSSERSQPGLLTPNNHRVFLYDLAHRFPREPTPRAVGSRE